MGEIILGILVMAVVAFGGVVLAVHLFKKDTPTSTPTPIPTPRALTPDEVAAKSLEADILRSVQELADASVELSMARRAEQADAKRREAKKIRDDIQKRQGP